ncbi:hypothetical protein DFH11DRAFT_1586025 [Phellopilus nigrolimitatus]|nr:hypothetical protein DFH11DRAFT_1586025 [Phellopilus nigrolimitatus]
MSSMKLCGRSSLRTTVRNLEEGVWHYTTPPFLIVQGSGQNLKECFSGIHLPPITSPSQKDNKAYWIKCLQALDQEDAPDLPRHIPASKLNASELEALVTRAKQRRLKYTAVESLRPTSRVTVPIWFGNWDRALGKSYGFGADVQLLPGGKLLLVLWSEGYLQCLEVPSGMCVWTHPDPGSYSAHGKHGLRVCNFGYDMQEDNVVHILTVSKSQDKYSKER